MGSSGKPAVKLFSFNKVKWFAFHANTNGDLGKYPDICGRRLYLEKYQTSVGAEGTHHHNMFS